MNYRNLSPVLAELIVVQFEMLCTIPVHISDKACQKSIQLIHAQNKHKVQQIRSIGPTQKAQLIKRLKEALERFNNSCKNFKLDANEKQIETLKDMASLIAKGNMPSSLVWTAANDRQFRSVEEVLSHFNEDFDNMKGWYKEKTGKGFRGSSLETLAKRILDVA